MNKINVFETHEGSMMSHVLLACVAMLFAFALSVGFNPSVAWANMYANDACPCAGCNNVCADDVEQDAMSKKIGDTQSGIRSNVLGFISTQTARPTDVLPWYPRNPEAFVDFHDPNAPRVVDNADLLTDAEEALLSAKIKDMEDRLDMDFVLYTDNSSYGLSRGQFAADFYTFNGYGRGDDFTGVVYFICMEPGNRGFWTAACGSAQGLMTEDNVNRMDDATYDYFKSGDYSQAIFTQFENLDILYTNDGFPIDWTPVKGAVFIAFIIALVLASKEVRQLKKRMETVIPARLAREYASSPVYLVKTDKLVNTVVTRSKHYEPSSDGGGSSGGSSSYSSGYHSSSGSSSHTFSGGGRSF